MTDQHPPPDPMMASSCGSLLLQESAELPQLSRYLTTGTSTSSSSSSSSSSRSTTQLRMLEFFSGIGGMRCAVERALNYVEPPDAPRQSHNILCRAYDISLEANRVYQHNFNHKDLIATGNYDQDAFPVGVCTKLVEQLRSNDIPPSELWTIFSKQRDLDDKRTAGFQALLHLLCTLPVARRPRWIFLENVAGFIGSRGHALLRQQLRTAEFQWKEYVLSPTDVGIPNQRTRYYLLAERESHRFTSREDELHRQAPFRKMYRDEPPHGATPGERKICEYSADCFTAAREAVSKVHLRSFLDPTVHPTTNPERWAQYVISDEILAQDWARDLPIVDLPSNEQSSPGCEDDYPLTYCFTAGYGRQLHKSTGSLLHIPRDTVERQECQSDADATVKESRNYDMIQRYHNQLRRFTPEELLGLFGFPPEFAFPSSTILEHRYRLVGNSISVFVVSLLMQELLLPPLHEDGM